MNAAYYQGVFPTSFDFPLLITIYAMVILGGAGSLAGSSSARSSSTRSRGAAHAGPSRARSSYGLILVGLVLVIRPWQRLAAVLGGLVAFGLVMNAIVGAVWPRGTAGPVLGAEGQFTTSGWAPEALRHWLVLPANTYTVPNYQIGNYAFVLLIALALTLTVVRGWVRLVALVPTL